MHKDERSILFFDLAIESVHRSHKGLPPPPHISLARVIKKAQLAGRAQTAASNGQTFYISDIKVFASRCEMLFGFSDPLAADPAFADRGKATRRVISKQGNEGLETSAHVIWRYGNAQNSSPCAFILEHATGINSGRIKRLLNLLLRDIAKTGKWTTPDPTGAKDAQGNFKQIKIRPVIDLIGHPSAAFMKDLKAGELIGVELVNTTGTGTVWDGNGYLVQDKSIVRLKVNKAKIGQKAMAALNALKPGAKQNYDQYRITFKTPSDVKRTVTVQSNYHLVNEDSYVRREQITQLGNNLATSFGAIYKPIISKMRKLT